MFYSTKSGTIVVATYTAVQRLVTEVQNLKHSCAKSKFGPRFLLAKFPLSLYQVRSASPPLLKNVLVDDESNHSGSKGYAEGCDGILSFPNAVAGHCQSSNSRGADVVLLKKPFHASLQSIVCGLRVCRSLNAPPPGGRGPATRLAFLSNHIGRASKAAGYSGSDE